MKKEKREKKEILKNFKKSERGSITVFVLSTMLLVVGVIFIAYFSMMNKSSSQAAELNKIQEEYNQSAGAMEQAYNQNVKTLAQAFKDGEIKVGDYIEYNPIATGDTGNETMYSYTSMQANNGYGNQNYSVNNDTEKLNWVVLGLSDDENSLLITTGSPIRKEGTNNPASDDPNFYLSGATGYINAETELNNVSAIYGHGDHAESARSIMVDDINKLTGYNPETAGFNEGKVNEYGNDVTMQYDEAGRDMVTYTCSNGVSGAFWFDEWPLQYIDGNQIKQLNTYDEKVTLTTEWYYYEIDESTLGDAYDVINTKQKYWFASKCFSMASAGIPGFDIYYYDNSITSFPSRAELFSCNGSEYIHPHAVRPVVTIKADTTIDEMPILEDQVEPEW